MDFVDWCERVLAAMAEACRVSSTARSMGLRDVGIAAAVWGEDVALGQGFWGSKRHESIHDAINSLEAITLIYQPNESWWRLTDRGEQVLADKVSLWGAICAVDVQDERRALLEVVNDLSPHSVDDYAFVNWIGSDALLQPLGWDFDLLWGIAKELEERGLIAWKPRAGRFLEVHATYRGLVWSTRRGWTIEAQEIDGLVADWETTNVEFKPELLTATAAQKAELIKDLLGLANTQVTGRRWLIVGFDDKTHRYIGTGATALKQDDLERLLHEYTEPYLHVVHARVDYRAGPVDKIEVLRDRRAVPYRVKNDVGDQWRGKSIQAGTVFVRHGSQTVQADVDEIAALEDEATWGREHQS